MSVLMKAYKDDNGEIIHVESGSFQDTDSVTSSLVRVPGLDVTVSNDLLNNEDLQQIINDYQAGDTSLQSQISSNTSNIATNTSNISTNTSNIATNTSNIATNTSNIATNTSNISTNTSNIVTNTSNIATNTSEISSHEALTNNPHQVTKMQVGLGNVDNTSDIDKPVSIATQIELDKKIRYSDINVNLYVAPDSSSAQTGDYVGPQGIHDAFEEANKIRMTKPGTYITIYLRTGEYAMTETIKLSHPQGSSVLRLRGLPASGATNSQNVYANTTGVATNDIPVLDANYSVILSYTTKINAIWCDKGMGIQGIYYIHFKKVGGQLGSGLLVNNSSYAAMYNCAVSGFQYPINVQENCKASISNCQLIHNQRGIYVKNNSSVSITSSSNYHCKIGYNTSLSPLYVANTSTVTASASSVNSHLLFVSGGNSACISAQSNCMIYLVRVETQDGSYGVYIIAGSRCVLSSCTVRGNSSYLAYYDRSSTGQVSSVNADPSGNTTQKTVRAYRLSLVNAFGTHINNPVFSPPEGDTSGANLGSYII